MFFPLRCCNLNLVPSLCSLKPEQMGRVFRCQHCMSAYLSAKLLRNNRTEVACFPVTIIGIDYDKQQTTVLIPYYDKAGQNQRKEAEVDSCWVKTRAPPADRLDLWLQEHADQLPVIKLPRNAAVRQIYPPVRQPKIARAQPAGSAALSNQGASVHLRGCCYMPVDSACACACASRAGTNKRQARTKACHKPPPPPPPPTNPLCTTCMSLVGSVLVALLLLS